MISRFREIEVLLGSLPVIALGMDAAETLPMPTFVMDELAQAPPDSLPMENTPQEMEEETPSICKLNTLRLDDMHGVKEI